MAQKAQMNSSDGLFYEVVVREEAPWVMAYRAGPHEKPVFSGLCIDLLKALSDYASFNYNIRLVDTHSYGHLDGRGAWNGLISELQSGAAKIAAGPIPRAPNEEGNAIVDYTAPYMSTKVNLLVKRPHHQAIIPPEREGIDLLFRPFKSEVWVMLCLAFLAVSLAMFLISRFSPFEWARRPAKDNVETRANRKMFELKNSFFFAASTISLQGYNEAPRSTSGRLLACMWFMFVLSIVLAYTASLGAILVTRSMPGKEVPVRLSSYEALMDAGRIKMGGVKNTYVYTTLRSGQVVGQGLLPRLYSYIDDRHEWVTHSDEGVQRVQDSGGKYAFVMETAKSEYIARSKCDVMTYGESLFRLSYSFAVEKKSPLRERLNMGIAHFREKGFIQQLHRKYLETGSCPYRDEPTNMASYSVGHVQEPAMAPAGNLDMRDMAVPFLLLFLGILASGGVLAAEIYYKKWRASKQRGPQDEKEREPLNSAPPNKIVRAPRSSPPSCPTIFKVNNKLQEEKVTNRSDPPPPPPPTSSIEVVIVNEKGKDDGDDYNDNNGEDNDGSVNINDTTTTAVKQDNTTVDDVTASGTGDNQVNKLE